MNKRYVYNDRIVTRLIFYFLGLFILTMGIAFSIKANLGVSPVTSVAYAMTCVWGIEIGIATTIFQSILVVVQILLLLKNFKWINCMQIVVGTLLGSLTSVSVYILSFLPVASTWWLQIIYLLTSLVLMSFGIYMYVNANIMHLPIEGFTTTLASLIKKEFHKIKIAVDCTMVIIAASSCLIFIRKFGSVGVGTIFIALCQGLMIGLWGKLLKKFKQKMLTPEIQEVNAN